MPRMRDHRLEHTIPCSYDRVDSIIQVNEQRGRLKITWHFNRIFFNPKH